MPMRQVCWIGIATAFFCHAATLNPQWTLRNAPTRLNGDNTCSAPSQVVVSGGRLTLTLEEKAISCTDPSGTINATAAGALLLSELFSFTYGTVEFRMQMPPVPVNNSHHWPWAAVWLFGTDCLDELVAGTGSCASATYREFDIAEIMVDSVAAYDSRSIWVGNPVQGLGSCNAQPVLTGWHTYTLEWTAGLAIFKIDGSTICTVTSANVPSAPMFIIIDLVNKPTGSANLDYPVTLQLDYIRVTQNGTVIFRDEFNDPTMVRGSAVVGSVQ